MTRLGFIRAAATLGVFAITLFSAGCAKVEGGATNLAINLIERRVIPPQLELDDVDMGCRFAQSNFPLLSAGTRAFHGDPSLLETLLYTSAGVCSEKRAVEEELRYLRASRQNNIEEAQDARIAQKRLLEVTARRQLAAFERMRDKLQDKYNFKYGDGCPAFTRDFDELVYLLGTIAGLQAVVNDIASQQMVGVPTDIAPKAERALTCISNAKWWGAPNAARAVVWNILPGMSAGKDVWGTFNLSMYIGEREGVRLSHVLYALSALSIGDTQRFRDATKRFAGVKDFTPSKDYRLIEEIADSTMQNLSDRYWTENVGTRTPVGSMGKYWDEKAALPAGLNVDDLLK
ncbi:hypothetical protein [Limnobacter litoralis]|uniref:Uncharacterized protein n=1 Tax=Limnobacter litoralis TaxID=481366 RepID=A0ABQ5YMH5_9BURK|nr:hypothetical protein [Limnobacter litoralis]GLR25794.1 hypothetical protein GCM10007875_08820 [Limnobacter litoralis]